MRITRRQRFVWIGIVFSRSNRQIGADLGISQRTVEKHRNALARNLGMLRVSTQAFVRAAATDKFFPA